MSPLEQLVQPKLKTTRVELARRLGVTTQYLSNVLKGRERLMTDVALRLSAELGIPVAELLANSKPPSLLQRSR